MSGKNLLPILIGVFIPFCAISQNYSEYDLIISAALEYPAMSRFLYFDEAGNPQIDAVISNNHIPRGSGIHVLGKTLRVISGTEVSAGFLIDLKKLKISQNRARLKFVYNQEVRARFRFRYLNNQWKVSSSFLRLKSTNEKGEKIRKWHFDF